MINWQEFKSHRNKILSVIIAIVATALLSLAIYEYFLANRSVDLIIFGLTSGIALGGVAPMVWQGYRLSSIEIGWFTARFEQRRLNEKERKDRQQEVQEFLRRNEDRRLPGSDAPQYDILEHGATALLVRPSAYPETPMYMLDKDFRIIDWNEAFALAFDKTMEGRIGESVLEWTYFLRNFEEVLDHGTKVFGSGDEFPRIDRETIEYESLRYGVFKAVKRAYQIPDDDGLVAAWLITMELKFPETQTAEAYRQDLSRLLSLDQLWSEYCISYDMILNNTEIYPELLADMVGETDLLSEIPASAKVVDLGAGTGNLALKLMSGPTGRLIVAIEKNRAMLETLRMRCRDCLTEDEDGSGIIVRKQDVSRLYGLRDNWFDYALMNNVLYAVEDVESCLSSVHRVLKPGGELRISGPHRGSNPDRLFKRIRKDLRKHEGLFEQMEDSFNHVYEINKYRLGHLLHRWSIKEQIGLLESDRRFEIDTVSKVYAGQSVLISARKLV